MKPGAHALMPNKGTPVYAASIELETIFQTVSKPYDFVDFFDFYVNFSMLTLRPITRGFSCDTVTLFSSNFLSFYAFNRVTD